MDLKSFAQNTVLLLLVVALSAGVSVVTSVLTEGYLNRYAQELAEGSIPPRLDEVRPRESADSYNEALRSVRESFAPSVVSLYPRVAPTARPEDKTYAWEDAYGFGVVLSSDGWVMTSRQALQGLPATSLQILVSNRVYDVANRVDDPSTNMVFLRARGDGLPVARFGESRTLSAGERVFAFEGGAHLVATTVLWMDAVSEAVHGSEVFPVALQTAAPGLSEGTVLSNARGELVGLVADGEIQPLHVVMPAIQDVLRSRDIERPLLGVRTLTLSRVKEVGEAPGLGARVVEAPRRGTPATLAGVRSGDVITHVDGEQLGLVRELYEILLDRRPGDVVTLRVLRGEETLDLPVELGRVQ